jgi:uncharacterized PurR-regulated membrane protein YhhQ (DUF165 family)
MIWLFVYVLSIVVANVLAQSFVNLPLGITISLGSFAFAWSFVARDRLHHAGGKRLVYAAIGLAAVAGVAQCVFTGVPYRIVLGATVALVLAEAADTEVFARLAGSWLSRALRSNLLSSPLDTVLFTAIAFYGTMPNEAFFGLVVGQSCLKYILSAAMSLIVQPRRELCASAL